VTATTHTPGPWHWHDNTLEPVEKDPSRSAVFSILDYDGGYGFLGSDHKATSAELDADRRLIAAAPDLHAALHQLHRVVAAMDAEQQGQRPSEAAYRKAMRDAALALAKATPA